MTTYIYPYKTTSTSVKALRQGLPDAKLIKLKDSKFDGQDKLVINWGNSNMKPNLNEAVVVNHPDAVAIAANKLTFFETAKGHDVCVPEYTKDMDEAEAWLRDTGSVIIREVLTGHSGKGIVFIDSMDQWEDYDHMKAKLYVKYVPKKEEYRVHVMGGEIIDIQRKAMRKDYMEIPNWKVRNYKNGFVFVREGVDAPEKVGTEAIKAVEAAGLDFGAVDVVWNNFYKKAVVLEVNTAPGLEGTTLKNYIEHLTRWANGEKDEKKEKKKVFAPQGKPKDINVAKYLWVQNAAGDGGHVEEVPITAHNLLNNDPF